MTIDIDNDSYWRPETGGALMGWHDPAEPKTEPMRKPLGDYEFPAYTFDKVGVLSPFWNEIGGDFKKARSRSSTPASMSTPRMTSRSSDRSKRFPAFLSTVLTGPG